MIPEPHLPPEASFFLKTIPRIARLSLLLLAGIILALVGSVSADAQTQPAPMGLPEYTAQLQAASSLLNENAATDRAAIHAFRTALPAEWLVAADGQTMHIKTDWLASALAIEENAPADAAQRLAPAREKLAALLDAAQALSASSALAAETQTRARLDRILSDREFQGAHGPSWFDKQKARVLAWINKYFEKIFGAVGVSAATGSAIAWALVLLVALLLAYWGVRYWISAARREEMDLHGAVPAGHDWRYWAAEARAAADRGDYRSAIHATYWSGVTRLEETRLLPQDYSRTPRESLRLLKPGSEAYAPLKDLTRRFELTWYGYHTATPADWTEAMRQLEALGCRQS